MPQKPASKTAPRKLSAEGETATHAWYCKDAVALISLADEKPHKIWGEALLIGAEDLLHQNNQDAPATRTITTWLPPGQRTQRLAAAEVRSRLNEAAIGRAATTYCAALVAWSNVLLLTKQRELPPEYLEFQSVAAQLAECAQQLLVIAGQYQYSELRALLSPVLRSDTYRTGISFLADCKVTALTLPPKLMVNLAERFSAGTVICREGSKAESMYVLLEGRVAVVRAQKCLARIVMPGEAFGEMGLFLDGERTASLVAETDCALYQISRLDLKQFHTSHPTFYRNLAATLAQRFHENINAYVAVAATVAKYQNFRGKEHSAELHRSAQQELAALVDGARKINESIRNGALSSVVRSYDTTIASRAR